MYAAAAAVDVAVVDDSVVGGLDHLVQKDPCGWLISERPGHIRARIELHSGIRLFCWWHEEELELCFLGGVEREFLWRRGPR